MTVDQQPIAPPVRERGYAVQTPGEFWAAVQTEKTAELRWPQCLEVYEDMDDQDGQVGSTLEALIGPILAAGWRLDGTGCRPEVVAHIAADLDVPIAGKGTDDDDAPPVRRRGRFSWHEHLQIAAPDHLQFGHAVFEQVYFPPTESPDGLLHLRKLGYRPPRTIAKFNIARDGGLVSVQQWAPGHLSPGIGVWAVEGPAGVTLPVNRLVVYVHRRKGNNWIGKSVLRRAYKNWLLKDQYLRLQHQIAHRNGMGLPVYTAAGTGTDELEAGQEIASAARAGDDSGIALPNGATLKLEGVTGTLVDIMAMIRYQDEQIARSMLANVLNLGQNRGTGSWSLGTTLQDVLSLEIKAICENVRDTANKYLIEDIVDRNWGPAEPAPRLVFDEIGSKNDAIIQAIAQLVANGVLQPDEDLETFVRTTLGLPPRGGAALTKPTQEAS